MMKGTAELLLTHGEHPDALRDECAAPDQGGEHHQEAILEIWAHGFQVEGRKSKVVSRKSKA